MLTLALITLLSQTEVPSTDASAAASAASAASAAASAERAASAAERAAVAAQKAAEAVAKLIEAQPAAAPAPVVAAAEEPKKDPWKGLVGLGLIAITGNSQTVTGTLNVQLDKKFGEWAFGARGGGAYGQTRPQAGGEPETTAARAGLLLRGDRNIASFASIFALGGLETDHVKSVELRGLVELGTGIKFYELKEGELERLYLRADVGFRYSHDRRFQYYGDALTPSNTGLPSVTMIGPRIGAVIRYAINKEIRFSEEAEFLPNVLGPERYLVNSNTKLNARLTQSLSISVSFLVTYDSAPAPGKQTTDTALTLGLEAAF